MAVVKLGKTNSKQEVHIGINEKQRGAVATVLSTLLADSYLLLLKTHYYHWNVSGQNFFSLHGMFEEQYKALFEAVDEIAERVRALGFAAPGTFKSFADLSGVAEDKTLPASAQVMVKNLLDAHEAIAQSIREALPAVEKAGDDVSADLLVERATWHDKAAWMLRSSL